MSLTKRRFFIVPTGRRVSAEVPQCYVVFLFVFCGTSPMTRFANFNILNNNVAQNAIPSLGKICYFATLTTHIAKLLSSLGH